MPCVKLLRTNDDMYKMVLKMRSNKLTCSATSLRGAGPSQCSLEGVAVYRSTGKGGRVESLGWNRVMWVTYPPNLHSRFSRYSKAASPKSSNATPWVRAWKEEKKGVRKYEAFLQGLIFVFFCVFSANSNKLPSRKSRIFCTQTLKL